MRTNDTVAGAIMILVALTLIGLTINFPLLAGQKYGPALFPRLLGTGLALCGLLLVLRGRKVAAPVLTLEPWARDPGQRLSFLLVLLTPFVAIFAWDRIGFVPLTFVTLLGLFVWFRVRPATAFLAALTATLLLQLFFAKLMRVPLPLGWMLNLPPHWFKYFT